MDRDVLLPVAPADRTWRAVAREQVPFSWRMALRRGPARLRWALRQPGVQWKEPHAVVARSSPLRRPGTTYDPEVQVGKETNVRRVAEALDDAWIGPGETWSWCDAVGPPVRARGFVDGPELQDGKLVMGLGGGACQVANLVFWLAASAGLTVVERHRHRWDLFPDSQRTVPFGCGATVFWPHRDLVLHNPHPGAVSFSFSVDSHLHGQVFSAQPLSTWQLVETAHRFVRHEGQIWRLNTVSRRCGAREEVLVHNKARVAYPVPEAALWR